MKRKFILMLLIIVAGLIIFDKGYLYNNDFGKNNMVQVSGNKGTVENEYKNIEENKEVLEDNSDDKYEILNINDVKIPILMYHSISDMDSNNSLLVPISQFEEQIKWLKENEFTPMLLDDVLEAYTTGYVPKKPVAITFDDGYSDNYTEAYRILKENNMKATFFIITDNTDNDGFYMNSSMLNEMKKSGMGIENHTSRHVEFTSLSREDKLNIIKEGRDKLKEKVGVDSNYVCYPVGKYDEETIEVEKELGIKAAVTTEYGISSLNDGLYSLKRVRIFPMSIESFKEIFKEFL